MFFNRKQFFRGLNFFLVMALAGTATAATFTVNSTSDAGGNTFTLRGVINATNSSGQSDVIQFQAGLGTIVLSSSLPAINERIRIDGGGAQVISGNNAYDIFSILAGADGCTVTGIALIQAPAYAVMLQSNCNRVTGCRLGTNWAGSAGLGNGSGLMDFGRYNDIGGALMADRNIISNNTTAGINLQGAVRPLIHNNFIGTDPSGTASRPNGIGILVAGSTRYAIIGGDRVNGEGNLISGNSNEGVKFGNNSFGNTLCGNTIGLNVGESTALPNASGVLIEQAKGNYIGQSYANYHNLIAGNTLYGIRLDGITPAGPRPRLNVIKNNRIGINTDSGNTYPNLTGIYLTYADSNLIGGNRAAGNPEYNVISGNTEFGIYLIGGAGNTVNGNYIGTEAAGTTAKGNGFSGIKIALGDHNLIGTYSLAGQSNVISGNGQYGIYLERNFIGDEIYSNVIQGNYIGTNGTGTAGLGNMEHGIYAGNGARDNKFGDWNAVYRNVISGNGKNGIRLYMSDGNQFYNNHLGVSYDGNTEIFNAWEPFYVTDSDNNTYGGTTFGTSGNVMCGQGTALLFLNACNGNTITGNFIGVLKNTQLSSTITADGIYMNGVCADNILGDNSTPLGNLIAGTANGIYINNSASDRNTFYANTICAFSTEAIMLAAGANQDQAAPGFSSTNYSWLYGTSGNNNLVEIFIAEPRAGGNGGSLRRLGSATAGGTGNWSLNVSGLLSGGEYLTGVATLNGNSSALAVNWQVPMPPSPTPSMTATPTSSITETRTASPTFTITRTDSPTPTVSPTLTSSVTASLTATGTITPTSSPTSSLTSTSTNTTTVSPTPTVSPTLTVSPEASVTSTSTITWTASGTSSPTVTWTSSSTGTFTPTGTLTSTFTTTATSTGTPSPTPTASPTHTSSPQVSNTTTLTATPTSSPTLTASPTNTSSPQVSSTTTLTATPTSSPTLTASPTNTSSPQVSVTMTHTHTAVITVTVTATSTGTATTATIPAGKPVQLYPMPARDNVWFKVEGPAPQTIRISVYNLFGELIISLEESNQSECRLRTAALASGCYFAKITVTRHDGTKETFNKKLAIVH